MFTFEITTFTIEDGVRTTTVTVGELGELTDWLTEYVGGDDTMVTVGTQITIKRVA